MKKIVFLLVLICSSFISRSDEGMIIPSLLSAFESDMQANGMQLSAEDIYSVNHSSMKDAIIHFGGGCTASLISEEGLLLTNHHCGFYYINSHSSVDNNIAKNGFWAKDKSEELKNPGLTGSRMIRIEDVTEKMLKGTEDLSGNELAQKVKTNKALLKAEAINGTHYSAKIKAFNFGNSYFLMVKETFNDIRLVGTPPKSVGKFGGDTDNWIWPRHTGDFSMFRIYADENNQPAEFSESNVPYSPLHVLPVSLKDRNDGDFAMIYGFPGRTYQHTISSELSYLINTIRPAQIKMRELSVAVIDKAMNKSEKMEIMYASKQARIANAWKKWKGQIGGLKIGNAVEKKVEYEDDYTAKATGKEDWNKEYGEVTSSLRKLSNANNKADFAYEMYIEYTYVGAELFERARAVKSLMDLYNSDKKEELKKAITKQKESISGFYKKYDAQIDQEILALQSDYYRSKISPDLIPASLQDETGKEMAEDIYENSFLVDSVKFRKVLNNFDKYAKNKIEKDPGYSLFKEVDNIFRTQSVPQLRTYFSEKNTLLKTYVKGKYEMYPDAKHWANANSTMRVSYGKIEGSAPRDGMKYTSHTTLDGVIAKYNTGNPDYELLPRMNELYKKGDLGGYDQDGELWVCFTSSLHTTGGNSGSPVIDGEGNLIGLNFDRSWESTMSDYMFDASRCRNISVDIRYVLWLIDIYGEAPYIVDEMTLVK